MKKMISITVLVLVTVLCFGQKVLVDQRKVDDLDSKIRECNVKIAQYTNDLLQVYDYSGDINRLKKTVDSLNKLTYDTQHGRELRDAKVKGVAEELKMLEKKQKAYVAQSWKISSKEALLTQVKKYEAQKEQLFQGYITDNSVPKELSRREVKLRKNGLSIRHDDRIETNQARLEELGYTKMLNSSVNADSINGYEGYVINLSTRSKITFAIYSIDAYGKRSNVETVSFFTQPGEKKMYNLLPGKYYCLVSCQGSPIGNWTFDVTPQKHYVLGEWCHWSVQREGY